MATITQFAAFFLGLGIGLSAAIALVVALLVAVKRGPSEINAKILDYNERSIAALHRRNYLTEVQNEILSRNK